MLLIEDDENKAAQISAFVAGFLPEAKLEICRAFQSGLKEAVLNTPDALLLDMTMPSYEVGLRETGGRERRYAGREILRQLSRRGKALPVIVITQYEQFEENGEIVTLAELVSALRKEYPAIFVDAIYYQAANTGWMEKLKTLLLLLQEKHDDH